MVETRRPSPYTSAPPLAPLAGRALLFVPVPPYPRLLSCLRYSAWDRRRAGLGGGVAAAAARAPGPPRGGNSALPSWALPDSHAVSIPPSLPLLSLSLYLAPSRLALPSSNVLRFVVRGCGSEPGARRRFVSVRASTSSAPGVRSARAGLAE
ncbi:hypothetical protein CDD83_1724 [Cordyceps sp. RAO-2017]|nr:hypothetical protein CDD83_1724 [Cordyceps sp. RAO-2017]